MSKLKQIHLNKINAARNAVKGAAAVVVPSLLMVANSAHAAAITVPAEVTDAVASVAVIGAAVFGIHVGVKLYKWIKGAL
jgi:hypothetical protein